MSEKTSFIGRVLARILPSSQPNSQRVVINRAPAGAYVNNENALTHTAVWCAIKLLAETMGSLNFKVLQPLANGSNLEIKNGTIYDLLNVSPNPMMSAATFRETLTAHVCGWGNGYAEIERDMMGRAVALWPLLPNQTKPVLDESGQLWYKNTSNGNTVYLEAKDVLHIHGFGFDGVMGYDPITYHSQAISQGLAVEQHTSDFFANGTHLNGALIAKGKLDKDKRANIRDAYNESYKGNGKAYRMAVFDNDLSWQSFSISPEASQLIESRKFKVSDIARIWRVPNHLLGDLEKATFSNIESQGIEFVQYTILPWAVRWESEINMKLLNSANPKRRAKMNLNVLMRGDAKSRYEAYKIGREWGWLSANDIRSLEDMNPIPGPAGKAYILPLNYQLARDIGSNPAPTPAPAPSQAPEPPSDPDPDEMSAAANIMAEDIASRISNKYGNDLYGRFGDNGLIAKAIAKNNDWLQQALQPVSKLFQEINISFSVEGCADAIGVLIQSYYTELESNQEKEVTQAAIKGFVLDSIKKQLVG